MKNIRRGYGFNIQENEELMEYIKEHTTNYMRKCTLIWFVDKDTGETVLWTGEVKDPYALRYQNNGEPDAAKIILLSFTNHKKVFSTKFRNLSKVIIMHEATLENHLPTFDKDGKPLNHDQFVVVNGTCSLRQGNGYYFEHEYSLGEPLYLLRYWATETQTITNMTSITVSELNSNNEWEQNTYKQDETNLYYILKRMFQITGYKTSVEDCTLDTLVNIKDTALLTNACRGINENFMSATIYNNLYKISNYINRLPVLYFNPNYDRDQDSENIDENKKEFLLFFERKESGRLFTEDEVFKNLSGYCECELATKDAGTIVVDAQNLVSSTPVWYPGYGYFCAATGEKGKLKLTEDDYVSIKLPTAIDKVLEVKVLETETTEKYYNNGTSEQYDDYTITTVTDKLITIPCIEEQEWINIATSSERKKYLYYRKYDNVIEINHSNYKTNGDTYFYSVKYIPVFDARIKMTHKNLNETSITQTDATLDSKSYGTFLKNYAKENCNTDYSMSKTYYSFKKILMPGDLIEMNRGGRLVVASTDVSRKNNSYFVTYVFNEYIVKRSTMVTASNLIDNKIIDKEASMKRFITIQEKPINVGLSLNTKNNNTCELNYIKDSAVIFEGYVGMYPELDYRPNIAFTKLDYDNGTSKYFAFNINKCQSGKSLLLNINCDDSTLLMCGSKIESGVVKQNIYHKYTDSFGKVNGVNIALSDWGNEMSLSMQKLFNGETITHKYTTEILEEPKYEIRDNVTNFVNEYPLIKQSDYINKEIEAPIKIDNLQLLKDTNEILNLSFQIDFVEENSDTILFDKFVELNPLLLNKDANETETIDNVRITKYYNILILDESNHIDESMTDINGIISLNDFKIGSLTCEMDSNDSYCFDFSRDRQYITNNQQVVLCRIVHEVNNETNDIINTHIYPLVAKTIRTKEKITLSRIYLEFFTLNE